MRMPSTQYCVTHATAVHKSPASAEWQFVGQNSHKPVPDIIAGARFFQAAVVESDAVVPAFAFSFRDGFAHRFYFYPSRLDSICSESQETGAGQ